MDSDVKWKSTVEIAAPVEDVYGYLANFPRHSEWAQSLVSLDLVKAGDASGVGAQYLTHERGLATDRKPREPLQKGMRSRTFCEVRELTPNRRIAWHAYLLPKQMGTSADYCFELAPSNGGTALTQSARLHRPSAIALLTRLFSGSAMDRKMSAYFEAGLHNIKLILEAEHV